MPGDKDSPTVGQAKALALVGLRETVPEDLVNAAVAAASRNSDHVQNVLELWNRTVDSGVGAGVLGLWMGEVRLALALSYGEQFEVNRLMRENLLISAAMVAIIELGLKSFAGMWGFDEST